MKEIVGEWLEENNFGSIQSISSVTGGTKSKVEIITTDLSNKYVVKFGAPGITNSTAIEVNSLNSLRVKSGPKIPKVYLVKDNFYLMEFIPPQGKTKPKITQFAHQLASMHQESSDKFGFEFDNFIGDAHQKNSWETDGFTFFGNHRLRYQALIGVKSGLLSTNLFAQIERIINQLPNLIPKQDPSLIHGDLWSGNILFDLDGNGVLIDPSTHFGWAEADLAMSILFGGLPDSFYFTYEEHNPVVKGWRDRADIYNLYHLLNHLNLFGGGYLNSITNILRGFD